MQDLWFNIDFSANKPDIVYTNAEHRPRFQMESGAVSFDQKERSVFDSGLRGHICCEEICWAVKEPIWFAIPFKRWLINISHDTPLDSAQFRDQAGGLAAGKYRQNLIHHLIACVFQSIISISAQMRSRTEILQ